MTVRLTRRLLLAALFAGPAASAAEPVPPPTLPVPVAPKPVAEHVHMLAVIMDVPTAVLNRHAAKYKPAGLTPGEAWEMGSDQANEFFRNCTLDGGQCLSRPHQLLADGQTGFSQIGQPTAVPNPTGGTVNVARSGMTLRMTPKLVGGDRVEMRLDFTQFDMNPLPVPITNPKTGAVMPVTGMDTQQIEFTKTVACGRMLLMDGIRKGDRTMLLVVSPSRPNQPNAAPAQPVPVPIVAPPVMPAAAPLFDVTVEWIEMPADDADRLMKAFDTCPQPGQLRTLTPGAADQLRAAARTKDAKVLTRPQLMVAAGQPLSVRSGGRTLINVDRPDGETREYGAFLNLTPTIATDGTAVALAGECKTVYPNSGNGVATDEGFLPGYTEQACRVDAVLPAGSSVVVPAGGPIGRKGLVLVTANRAATPPRPMPVMPAADGQVYLSALVAEVPTAALDRLTAKHRPNTKGGPEPFSLDAAAAEQFARDCAAGGEILSRPQLLLTNGQTGFFQVGQQYPLVIGETVAPGGGTAQNITYSQIGLTLKVTPKLAGDRVVLKVSFERVCPVPAGEPKDGKLQPAPALETQAIETTQSVPFGRVLVLNTVRAGDKTVLLCLTATRLAPPVPVPAPLPPAFAVPSVRGAMRADSCVPTDMARDLATQQAQARLLQSNLRVQWHPPAWPATAPSQAVFPTPPAAVGYRLSAQPGVQLVQAVPPPSPSVLLTGSPVMPAVLPVTPPSRVFHVRDLPLPPAAPAVCTKAFPVMDLVTPIPEFVQYPTTEPCWWPTAEKNAAALVKLLTAHIQPGSWKPDGGTGSAEFFPIGGVLVVNHTAETIREVETLLDALRKAQDVCVATEVRVVRLPTGAGEKAGLCDGPPAADKPVVLSGGRRLEALAAVLGDGRADTMQLPKITQFNGQTACVCVGDLVNPTDKNTAVRGSHDSLGVRFNLQPVVSADRRTVRVAVGGTMSCDADSLLAVKHAAAVPDGQTLVLYAGRRAERVVRCEFGPPVLSQIPYVNRLFKNTGIGTEPAEDVFVLVTPRIVVNHEPGEPTLALAAFVAPPALPAAELVAKYKAALAAGKTDEAVRLAVQALALDPHCFGR